ncbi:hypothetical protein GPM19_01730 [Halomonas sp. ZH2S]|uniref:Uncharacterized protein n=1 Tax=Vreelandella zhuhanensis TaxID=2684210 RepID=A0A7X3GXW6_9GAMM|nr:hypothetical protein [Halomonas zhuhanensis]MWJ26942.1 hypothetical protein [Halomonas zhuhanensis]
MQAVYRRSSVLIALAVILVLIMADHLQSPTFAFNMGRGNVETTLMQQDSTACAPCGAPCPSARE